jgi:hypothetical protein
METTGGPFSNIVGKKTTRCFHESEQDRVVDSGRTRKWSELEARPKSENARTLTSSRSDVTEGSRVRLVTARVREVWMIERVQSFGAELKIELLIESDRPVKTRIDVEVAGPADLVPSS